MQIHEQPETLITKLQQENESLSERLRQRLQSELAQLREENNRLRQSESRYRQLFENSPISIVIIGADGRMVESNRAYEQLYGCTHEQYNASKGSVFSDRELIENGSLGYMQQVLAGETVQEAITYYDGATVASEGKFSWNQALYFPIRDQVGKVQEIVEICLNHTELVKAQQTLQQERDRAATERANLLSTVAQVANLLLRSQDYNMVLPDVVRLLGEAVGSDRCAFIRSITENSSGRTVYKILAEWSSESVLSSLTASYEHESIENDYLVIEDDFLALHERLRQGEVVNYLADGLSEKFRRLCEAQGTTSGLVVPIFVQGLFWGHTYFDNCGEPRLYDEAEIAILQVAAESLAAAIERQAKDKELLRIEQERSQELERLNAELQQTLERLSESEQHYRRLMELASEGIYRYQFDEPMPIDLPVEEKLNWLYQHFRIVEHNLGFAEMYGYDRADALVGFQLPDFHTSVIDNTANMVKLFEDGHRARNLETVEIDRVGRKKYFFINAFDIIENGYAIGGWGTQIDITELRLAQQALLQAEQERVAELAKTNQALKNSLDRLATDPCLDAFLGHVLIEISQQLDIYAASLHLYDPASQTLQVNNWVEGSQVLPQQEFSKLGMISAPIHIAEAIIWEHLLQSRFPFVITRANAAQFMFPGTHDWQLQWADEHGVQAGINILLAIGDTPLGLLGLLSTKRSEFTCEELELAQALAHQATLAVQLTRLAEEAKQAAILDERNRLAREIHDTLAQAFAGIGMQLQAADRFYNSDRDKAQTHLDRAQELAKRGLSEARRSVWVLCQEGEEYRDLSVTLPRLVEQMSSQTTVQIHHNIQGTPYNLEPEVGTNLLRIVQESLNNALQHARAPSIAI